MNATKMLGIIVVLQALILIGQWTGSPALPTAQAQVPDPAGRQMAMIDELKALNAKLDKLVTLMESGDLQVKVAKSDDDKGAARK